MKKLITSLIVGSFFIIPPTSFAANDDILYKNQKEFYSIKYPANWYQVETFPELDGSEFEINNYSEEDQLKDGFDQNKMVRINISTAPISKFNVGKPKTITDFIKTVSKIGHTKAQQAKLVKEELSKIKLMTLGKVKVKVHCKDEVIKDAFGTPINTQSNCMYIYKDKIYFIGMHSENDVEFSKNKPIFEKIVKSIRLL